MGHHHQQMVTHPNNFQTRDVDIHWVFLMIFMFFLFYFAYLPGLPFHLGRPSNNKLIWHGLMCIIMVSMH